jgi:tagaturonate reductase
MILQFGTGNFLRGFADLFADELGIGPVVAVQSTGGDRGALLNQSGGRYHVAIQGIAGGRVVDETIEVRSISRALFAATEWAEVLAVARDPDLVAILSNTTEAGFVLEEADARRGAGAPVSFPAKLLVVLVARYEAGLSAPWVLPCELIDGNGARLKDLVLAQAGRWEADGEILAWLANECRWVNTLVDRIVPGPPRQHPLLGVDPLLIMAEPFALWAVETVDPAFPFAGHPAVVLAPDITSYSLRKIRILNGAHTALVCRALGSGRETVRECLDDPEVGAWLEGLLFEEIVPVLEGRCDDPAGFARAVLDRFRNPFLEHRLASIALNHEAKVATRLRPTLQEYRERFGEEPPRLAALMAEPQGGVRPDRVTSSP